MTERERFEVWAKKNKDKDGCWLLVIKNSRGDYIDDATFSAWQAWRARCPDGYAVVPTKITAESGHKYALIGEFSESVTMPCPECDEVETADNDCEYCYGDGDYEQRVPIDWNTIKRIHDVVVSVSAAPHPGEES